MPSILKPDMPIGHKQLMTTFLSRVTRYKVNAAVTLNSKTELFLICFFDQCLKKASAKVTPTLYTGCSYSINDLFFFGSPGQRSRLQLN